MTRIITIAGILVLSGCGGNHGWEATTMDADYDRPFGSRGASASLAKVSQEGGHVLNYGCYVNSTEAEPTLGYLTNIWAYNSATGKAYGDRFKLTWATLDDIRAGLKRSEGVAEFANGRISFDFEGFKEEWKPMSEHCKDGLAKDQERKG